MVQNKAKRFLEIEERQEVDLQWPLQAGIERKMKLLRRELKQMQRLTDAL